MLENPTPIKLKRKYTVGGFGAQKSKSSNSGTNKHKGIDSKQKQNLKPWREMAMYVDAKSGRKRMRWTGRMLRHTGTQIQVVKD